MRAQSTLQLKKKKVVFLFFKLVLHPRTTSGAAIPSSPHLINVKGTDKKAGVKNKHTWKTIVHVDDHLPT